MATMSQLSFAGGEIAPAVHGRVDMVKRDTGLRTCRNFMVQRYGSVTNRPGTKYVGEVKDSADVARMLPFVYSDEDAYVLELGDFYMRFIQDGAYLAVSGVSAWSGATTYVPGDLVVSGGVNYYCIGQHVNQTPPNSSYWYALTGSIYEIPTPWAVADLARLRFGQNADTMTVVHPSYPPQEITFYSATRWVLQAAVSNKLERFDEIPFGAANGTYGGVNVRSSGGASTFPGTLKYKVTAIDSETGRETNVFHGPQSTLGFTNITKASPPVFTTNAAHGLLTGDEISVEYIDPNYAPGWDVLNGRSYIVKYISATTFSLEGVDTTGVSGTWGTPGSGRNGSFCICWEPVASTPVTFTPVYPSTHVSGPMPANKALLFNIYKLDNGSWSLLGTCNPGQSFTDSGSLSVDSSITAPPPNTLFMASGGYPSSVTYYQQRRIFGGSTDNPERVWASLIADYAKFTRHNPAEDTDMVQFDVMGDRVAEVRHVLDLGKLVIMTSAGEKASTAAVLTPSDISLKQSSYNGVSYVRPLPINNTALYVQARGAIVRDLAFDFASDGYNGNDLTVFSSHLFEGHSIVDWAYAQNPHSIVWAVRDDGVLLGLTYVREHQVWGWHRHDTDGVFENVCVIPEGDEDVLYAVVKRTIDGSTKRYVERFHTRLVDEDAIEEMVFVDCSLSYDGTISAAAPVSIYNGARGLGAQPAGTAALEVDGYYFDATHVGKTFLLKDADGNIWRFVVSDYEDTVGPYWNGSKSKVAYGEVEGECEADAYVYPTIWSLCASTFSGLEHLEGKDVTVFADGFVVANPNVSGYPVVTVSGGSVTLSDSFARVHIGLPVTADFENLDLDSPQGETMVDKKKLVNKVTLRFEKTRGGYAGTQVPTSDAVDTSKLREFPQRSTEGYLQPTGLETGPMEVNVQGQWNNNGRVFVRQSDPLPMTILSIHPAGYISGGK